MNGCKTAEARNSPPMAAKKPTEFLSDSVEMLNQLGRRCDGSHEHKQLRGKDLSEAAFYPDGLVLSIIKGMNLTHAAEMVKRAMRADAEPAESLCSARINGYRNESKVLGT